MSNQNEHVGWLEARKRVVRSRLELFRLIRVASRPLAAAAIASTILSGVLPAALIVSGGVLAQQIQDAVGGGRGADLTDVYIASGLVVALFLLGELMVPLQRRLRWLLSRRIDGTARDRVMRASLVGSDMARLHAPELLSAMRRLRGFVWYDVTPGGGAAGMLGIARDYITGFAAAIVVAWYQPVLAILAVAVGLVERVRMRDAEQAIVRAWIDAQPEFAEARYFTELGLRREAVSEVRLFDLGGWLRERMASAAERAWSSTWAGRTRWIMGETPIHVVLVTAAGGLALAWAAGATGRGELSIADLIVFVPAVFTVLGLGNTFQDDNSVEYGTVMLPALDTIEQLARESGELERGARSRPGELAPPAVALHGVSFAYPGADGDTVHGIDLEIPAGTSATLVGANGAGKTTLIRLMCGLYRPRVGTVTVDDVDLRELDMERWHQDIAAMFQEFVRLPASVSENVAAGAVDRLNDLDAVSEALDEAAALGFSSSLRDGLQTRLATWYAEGSDVSGGQWQRLAIARALFSLSAGARFLVLDEPTSNLDTVSEERLIRRLLDGTRGTSTTLLVTHRLGLARRTDRIFVIEAGRVVESGTHDDLMMLGSRYASAFDMQASLYPLEESPHG